MSPGSRTVVLTALGLFSAAAFAPAKPPGLPIKGTITCQPSPARTPADPPLSGNLALAEEPPSPIPDPVGESSRLGPPPIDPKLVDALERLLAETNDPEMPKLIIQDQEPPPPEETEADTGLGWPLTPGDPDLASRLAAELAPGPSTDDESDDPEEGAAGIPETPPDWDTVLREAIEAVSAGRASEIDASRLEHLRIVCERQVGNIFVQIISDGDSLWPCTVVSLAPGAGGDLRSAQRAHNEFILHWIEALSDSTGADLSDDDPDDWDEWWDDDPAYDGRE
jgi:hypothetical protein